MVTKLKNVTLATLAASVLVLSACGQRPSPQDEASDTDWIQSRTGTQRYAYLEQADLTDTFIFGATVISTSDFPSAAMDMTVRPLNVKLALSGNTNLTRKLNVSTTDNTLLMSFNVKKTGNQYEVDFASAGNDVRLRGLIDYLGGIYTAGDESGVWVSTSAPAVLGVQQDKNTVVVDLLHTVSQAVLKADGETIDHIVSDHPGKVTVRLFLKRKKSVPQIGVSRTVAQGKAKNIGFFGPDLGGDNANVKIQRFALGDANNAQQSITFYLKDVPANMQDVAKSAVLSWNKAFGPNKIKVAIAPAGLDVGDPRVNVIRWYNGLDKDTGWAGVAKMIVEPDTGVVMGGHLYINGSTVQNLYKGIVAFTEELTEDHAPTVFTGTIGNVTFTRDVGEKPVIPFASQLGRDFEDYMQGYYEETIAHEVGHVLGLRHNFRGTVALENGQTASVMDYAPRAERAHFEGPGSYDVAAIKWGYFGQSPNSSLRFCTDEDLWSFLDCNQGDWGEPTASAINGLVDGTKLLSESAAAVTSDDFISSLGGSLENAYKIKKLQAQLPSGTRAATLRKVDAAISYMKAATPAAGLSSEDRAIVLDNLAKVKVLAEKKEEELRAAGRL